MFSFPSKVRSLEWVGRALTNNWPGNIYPGQELEMNGGSVGGSNNQRRDSQQAETGSNGQGNCVPGGGGDHVVVEMDESAGEADGGEQEQFMEDGAISRGVLLGGVVLGGLVIQGDEESGQEQGPVPSSAESVGEENRIQGGGAGGDDDARLEETSVGVGGNSEDGGESPVLAAGEGGEGSSGSGNEQSQDGHVIVDMEESSQVVTVEKEEPVLTGPSRYLKRCQDMSYYLGVSGFKPFQRKKAETWYYMAGRILQKVVNSPAILASLVQSLFMIKGNYFGILFGQKYSSYVAFAFAFACLLVKIYSTYMMSFKKKKTERMLTAMHEYEEAFHPNPTATGNKHSWKLKLVSVLAISTFVCACAIPLLEGRADTTEDLILDASHELSVDVLKWTPNMTTDQKLDLKINYGAEMTGRTVTMGCFVLFRDAASYLQIWMVLDLVVIVTGVMFAYVAPLIKEIKEVTPNVPFERFEEWMALQARREEVWRKYVKLRKVKDEVNDLFDPLLKLLHMRNLTTYAFFMSLVFFKNNPWVLLLIFAVNLLKGEIAYFLAGKIAEVNDAMRALIHNWASHTGKITVGDEEFDAGIILDQLEKDPIGLGKGKLLIHHEFHFKFVALVWSVFFSMADEETGA